jgi:hypothetical protein
VIKHFLVLVQCNLVVDAPIHASTILITSLDGLFCGQEGVYEAGKDEERNQISNVQVRLLSFEE